MGCNSSSAIDDGHSLSRPFVVFVLGGPGCGKGTQCDYLVRDYKFKHLSAGDLLREEQKKGGPVAEEIEKNIKEGTLVSSELIVKLIKKAIAQNGIRRYLIDGFPRDDVNLSSWNSIIGSEVDARYLIYFNCPEEKMVERIMERGKTSGRTDDNPETIKKRLATFTNSTIPVLELFKKQGKVIEVNADKGKEEVYEELKTKLTEAHVHKPHPPTVYFVVGGPGSGKGTQCDNLVRDYGFRHLSTGDLLRQALRRGTKEGAVIDKAMKQGKLVSSDMLINLIRSNMEKHNYEGKYLIDGLPRNQENVDAWDKNMGNDVNVEGIIYFKCSDAVMEQRLLQRGKTSGRSDDNIDTIKKRFDTFHKETEPVINAFQAKGKVVEVNAEHAPKEVYDQLQKKLAEKGLHPKKGSNEIPNVVFVLGGPGCGKGTQCQRMVRDFGFIHLSTGDLLREEEKHKGLNDSLINEYITAGKLVPSEILVRLIQKAVRKEGSKNAFLLDGFPRSGDNIEAWQEEIGPTVKIRNMIFFECSEKVMEERLLGRAKTSGRADDNPDTIKKRFATFSNETKPVLANYEKQGIVIKVNAEKSPDDVYTQLKAKLIENGFKPK